MIRGVCNLNRPERALLYPFFYASNGKQMALKNLLECHLYQVIQSGCLGPIIVLVTKFHFIYF